MLEDQAMNEQRNALKASEDIKEASKDIKEETRKRKLPSESQGSKRRHVDKVRPTICFLTHMHPPIGPVLRVTSTSSDLPWQTIDDDVIIVDDHDEQPDKVKMLHGAHNISHPASETTLLLLPRQVFKLHSSVDALSLFCAATQHKAPPPPRSPVAGYQLRRCRRL
eukprot:24463-Hanusia_phi.AAC.1